MECDPDSRSKHEHECAYSCTNLEKKLAPGALALRNYSNAMKRAIEDRLDDEDSLNPKDLGKLLDLLNVRFLASDAGRLLYRLYRLGKITGTAYDHHLYQNGWISLEKLIRRNSCASLDIMSDIPGVESDLVNYTHALCSRVIDFWNLELRAGQLGFSKVALVDYVHKEKGSDLIIFPDTPQLPGARVPKDANVVGASANRQGGG